MTEPIKDTIRETEHGQSEKTPFVALTGVTLVVAVIVAIVLVAAVLAYVLA
jgi:hypothetical protein